MTDLPKYSEDDYLQLSGIQHYAFCPRQWALIHIEMQWQENYLTVSGEILHNKAHDNSKFEKRGNLLIARALKISSHRLGLSGECDVVEFHKSQDGISLHNFDGKYIPFPVEYKRGKSKIDDCDRVQLCAQSMCLEEMLSCEIKEGALFYGEPRRRETVVFSSELKAKTEEYSCSMHELFVRRYTPKAKFGKQCESCSIKNECIPGLFKKTKDVLQYLKEGLL